MCIDNFIHHKMIVAKKIQSKNKENTQLNKFTKDIFHIKDIAYFMQKQVNTSHMHT